MSEITESKFEEYYAEIKSWKWEKIVANAKRDPEYDYDSDGYYGREYLGTVFGITPSGKVYTPFANSNVTLCPHCNGVGQVENPNADGKRHEVIHAAQHALRMSMIAQYGPYYEGKWPEDLQLKLDTMQVELVETRPMDTCPHCDGLGSEEACWDQLFNEALQKVAEEHGGFIDHYDENIYFAIECPDPREDDENDE